MKVREAMERLKNGESTGDIAKEIGLDISNVRKKLKALGYQYDGITKNWSYADTSKPEPLDVELKAGVRVNRKETVTAKKEIVTAKRNTVGSKKIENVATEKKSEESLSSNDLKDLQKMLREWREGSKNVSEGKSLHEQIKALERQKRTRKTVVISEDLSERLLNLATRERFDQSDLLELALIQFFEKYE